jgi:hypothetical protein
MAVALLLVTAFLAPGGPPPHSTGAVPARAGESRTAPGADGTVLPCFTIDPRRGPFSPDGRGAESFRRERATEAEEESNPPSGPVACWTAPWHTFSAPGPLSSGNLPLPGGKVLPQLLPSLRC